MKTQKPKLEVGQEIWFVSEYGAIWSSKISNLEGTKAYFIGYNNHPERVFKIAINAILKDDKERKYLMVDYNSIVGGYKENIYVSPNKKTILEVFLEILNYQKHRVMLNYEGAVQTVNLAIKEIGNLETQEQETLKMLSEL